MNKSVKKKRNIFDHEKIGVVLKIVVIIKLADNFYHS